MPKLKLFLVGSRRRVSVSQENHLRVGNHDISFKGHVKNIGVYIDTTLSMVKHTDHISHSAYHSHLEIRIRRVNSIRHLLTTKSTTQLMCSFVLSRLDCCNSLLIDINRLQKVQNHAAKVVSHKSRHEHVRALLKALHWLPVKERIILKIATFVFLFL